MSVIKSTFLRFLIAGGLNTLFGFAVYTGLILLGVPLWAALIFSTLAGIAFNFITTGGYAFRDLSYARLPRFVICYFLVFGANFGLITVCTGFLHDKILAQLILAPFIAVFSYFLLARFVFLRKYRPINAVLGKNHP